MRNNFNTSAFSELKFEIEDDPAEAWFSYTGKARFSPRRGISASIGPAMFGTLKSARKFVYPVRDLLEESGDVNDPESADDISPLELALTGLGACSLKTLIGGGSARGITFETVDMLIGLADASSAAALPAGSPAAAYVVDCQFQIETSAGEDLIAEVLQQVQEYSPNHRTVTDKMPLAVRYRDTEWRSDEVGEAGRAAASSAAARCQIAWITGPQFESWLPGRRAATRRNVDAPKQLTGADWGPNAQEYLLMGLAADMASNLNHCTVRGLGRSLPWNVVATARVDAGGLLDTGESYVGLQDMNCLIDCPGAGGTVADRDLETIVVEAWSASIVRALLADPQTVDFALVSTRSAAPRSIGRRAS